MTSRLRVGSGGVMLPTTPLVVAEQFGTLEALHPGRIDMGIGRAAGTDPVTARALRRSVTNDDFGERLAELIGYFSTADDDGPALPVTATPAQAGRPPLWLLGSSGNSARVAAMLGLPFAFAHHFSAENTVPALRLYRRASSPRPSWRSRTRSSRRSSSRPTPTSGPSTSPGRWPCPRCSSAPPASPGPIPARRRPRSTRTPRSSGSTYASGSTPTWSAGRRRCAGNWRRSSNTPGPTS
ncbi:MsnO8 family LLM class oxidoreductase [Streptomyces sp. M19]